MLRRRRAARTAPPVRELTRRLYALVALDDLVPLYPVYTLLFADSGLTPGQISTLFMLWSFTAFVLEVPSGALADRVSRRQLLVVGLLLRAAGYLLWVSVASYPAFAAGFVLWGTKSALTSGTREALVYDVLGGLGATAQYPRLIARSEVIAVAGVLVGTALAAPLVAVGGYRAAGWVSITTSVAGAVVAAGLPEPSRDRAADSARPAEPSGLAGYLATLRAGLAEAAGDRRLRRLLLVAALLPGLTALDEYLPLAARATGASDAIVPLLLLAPYLGLAVGAEAAARRSSIRPARLAVLTAAGAVLLAIGAASGHPSGFVGIGACYAVLWFGTLVAQIRLQETMTGVARATVTSVAGVGDEAAALGLYLGYAVGSRWLSVSALVVLSALPMVALAAVLARWLPAHQPVPPDRDVRSPHVAGAEPERVSRG